MNEIAAVEVEELGTSYGIEYSFEIVSTASPT